MRIALIGGHGKVALRAAPLLVAAGHTVTSVIRNPDHIEDVTRTGATPKVLDVETLDHDGWNEFLAGGFDAVVWSAGAGGGNPGRTWAAPLHRLCRRANPHLPGLRQLAIHKGFGNAPEPNRTRLIITDQSVIEGGPQQWQ